MLVVSHQWLLGSLGVLVLLLFNMPMAFGQEQSLREELDSAWDKGAALKKEGRYREAATQYERALELARKVVGENHLKTAAILNNLANLYRNMGQNREAEGLYQRSLSIHESQLGQEHPLVATSLNNLGDLYRVLGQYTKAEPLLQRSQTIRETQLGKDHLDVAQSLNTLGILYMELSQYRLAETLYQRCLAIREAQLGKDHPDVAETLGNLAILCKQLCQFRRAEQLNQRCLTIFEAKFNQDHPKVADSLNNLAVLYHDMGEYARVEPLYQRSLTIRETKLGKDHPDVAQSLNNLANLYGEMDQYARAEPLHLRSLAIRETQLGKNHPDVATSLNNLANLYIDMGQYTRSELLIQRSRNVYEAGLGQDHPHVATSLNNLGNLYEELGQFAKAESLYQRSLRIKEAILGKDHPDVTHSLNNLANLFWKLGQYAKAEPLYQRSLAIRKEKFSKDHLDVAGSLNNLANLYHDMAQYPRAEPLYQSSLNIKEAQLGKEHTNVALTLNNLANLYSDMGQYAKAEPLYQRSLTIRETKLGKDHPDVASSLNNLANLYSDMGQYPKAEPLYQRSLTIRETKLGKDHPDVANSLNNLASLYRKLGRFAKAEPLFQRSLKIRETKLGKDHPDVASSLNTLALLQVDQQHLTEPASLADRSRHIIRIHVARTLPLLSEKEQLTFLEKTDEKRFHAWQSFSLIRRGDAALAALSAAWVVNGKAVAHEALAERALLVREQKNPAAAELAQQLLQVRRQLAALSLASPKPSQEEGHRQYLARLNEQEQDLSRRLGQASGRASRDDPWVNPDEIRKKLPANTVLVELSRFRIYNFQRKTNEKWWQPGHYAAWVIPPAGQGNVSLIDLGEADQIEKAVQVVQQALKDSPQGIAKAGEPDSEKTLQQSLQNLSRLVLQPLLPHLEKKYCWLLSPDAALWLVPWAALPLPDGKYSLEKHQISYLVSGRDLVRPVAKVKPTRPMVLADPDFDLGLADARKAAQELLVNPQPLLEFRGLAPSLKLPPVPRLKGTATEAKAIQPTLARYAGQKPWIFLEEQALEGVFKALASPQVLVLSTHGFFLPKQEVEVSEGAGLEEKGPVLDKEGKLLENPLLRCGLLLAGCNQREALGEQDEDGVLTGLEIVGTDLRGTELVVLSACETGLGDVRTGEGVAGLRQAFQLAGASAVVATLWSIPDRESARLMSDFFGNLAKGQSKAAALREAQLMRIKAHRERSGAAHPFFWAAFTLTGR